MNIYIAGPMRGYPEFNFPAFFAAEERLRERTDIGVIFNPARRDNEAHGTDISAGNTTGDEDLAAEEHGFSLREALGADTDWICHNADAIYMLRGWQNSSGARAELALAEALGHKIEYEGLVLGKEETPVYKSGYQEGYQEGYLDGWNRR